MTSFSLGVYAFVKQRQSKCAVSFILSMFIVTIWSAGNALEMSGTDLSTKLFWANVQYLAYCFSPVSLLALCMQFTGYDRLIRNKKIWWFTLLPAIIILLVWTDGWHGLIRYDMYLDYSGSFPIIAKKYGPVFYIHAAYAHFLNITAWVMLIRAVFYRKTIYRKQAIILLIGVSLIVFPNLLYIMGLIPYKRFDPTPIFFGPAGILIFWAIFRYKMFDLVPLARTTVIETMDAGMMVLDLQNRILDINPAFEKITSFPAVQTIAHSVKEVCKSIPELLNACLDRNETYVEFSVNRQKYSRVYEAVCSPLSDDRGVLIGRLVVVSDVTERSRSQETYLEQQRKFAAAEERENMAKDLHDNLGQILGFINLQAQGIRQELSTAGVDLVTSRLDKLVEVTQSANKELRTYIRSVRNILSDELNLSDSIKQDILCFEERTEIQTTVTGFNLIGLMLEPKAQLQVLNIIKEALNNIQKHSKATQAKIEVKLQDGKLGLSVEDNGIGFNLQAASEKADSFGLTIMRERASEIGADFDIRSEVGKGCRVTLCVSIRERGMENENHAGR
jgi:PAS domain S-box-containing protein